MVQKLYKYRAFTITITIYHFTMVQKFKQIFRNFNALGKLALGSLTLW